MNEADSEGGGIYLFDDKASAQAFLTGPLITGMMANPVVSNISVKLFDVTDPHTAVTRGPVRVGERV